MTGWACIVAFCTVWLFCWCLCRAAANGDRL